MSAHTKEAFISRVIADLKAQNRVRDAAPELLDSLIELEDVLGRMNEAGEVGHSVRLNRARAAIAQATGGDV